MSGYRAKRIEAKKNKNVKRSKSKCGKSREKEPVARAVHGLHLLMFRNQEQQSFKTRERGGENAPHRI